MSVSVVLLFPFHFQPSDVHCLHRRELKLLLQPFSTFRFDARKCSVSDVITQTHETSKFSGHFEWPYPVFDVLNLVPVNGEIDEASVDLVWKAVGNITRYNQTINAIR